VAQHEETVVQTLASTNGLSSARVSDPAETPDRRSPVLESTNTSTTPATAQSDADGESPSVSLVSESVCDDDSILRNEAIYERAGVKRGGADFLLRASRTSPSPSASVDLAHLRPVRGRIGRATRNISSEPEAEGEFSPSMPAVYEALADVT
jgi:hypothetical protein